jgi:hypothetical protein
MHDEFLRLLFLQAHRETEAHFTATGMPSHHNPDKFRFCRSAFYQGPKSKVRLAAAKTVELRINLNIDGCGVVAPPSTLLNALLFFSPSSFHTISLSPAFTSA